MSVASTDTVVVTLLMGIHHRLDNLPRVKSSAASAQIKTNLHGICTCVYIRLKWENDTGQGTFFVATWNFSSIVRV